MNPIGKYLASFHNQLLDFLFPKHCFICHRESVWLCSDCLKRLPPNPWQCCPHCEQKITPTGETCFNCLANTPLSGLFVASSYQQPIIKNLLHHAKYSYIPELADLLGVFLGRCLNQSAYPIPDCIIPVPLHPRRLRWRGFNQAERISRQIAFELVPEIEIPIITNALKKTKHLPPQMKINSYVNRFKNVQEAFQLSDIAMIRNKRILLVDDVATTGATITECARLLKKNGAKEVWGAVIARQSI